MSVAELQSTITRLTAPQRRAVAHYIKYLVGADAPNTLARRRRITRVLNDMDQGEALTLEEVRRLRAKK